MSMADLAEMGGAEGRRFFLREAMRVARAAFITVPNRWFPTEHHTGIPLVHFSPRLFRLSLQRASLAHWACPENLDFLGRRLLAREWRCPSRLSKISYRGIGLGPFSSNIALHDRPHRDASPMAVDRRKARSTSCAGARQDRQQPGRYVYHIGRRTSRCRLVWQR
jgi:hypothetical protein